MRMVLRFLLLALSSAFIITACNSKIRTDTSTESTETESTETETESTETESTETETESTETETESTETETESESTETESTETETYINIFPLENYYTEADGIYKFLSANQGTFTDIIAGNDVYVVRNHREIYTFDFENFGYIDDLTLLLNSNKEINNINRIGSTKLSWYNIMCTYMDGTKAFYFEDLVNKKLNYVADVDIGLYLEDISDYEKHKYIDTWYLDGNDIIKKHECIYYDSLYFDNTNISSHKSYEEEVKILNEHNYSELHVAYDDIKEINCINYEKPYIVTKDNTLYWISTFSEDIIGTNRITNFDSFINTIGYSTLFYKVPIYKKIGDNTAVYSKSENGKEIKFNLPEDKLASNLVNIVYDTNIFGGRLIFEFSDGEFYGVNLDEDILEYSITEEVKELSDFNKNNSIKSMDVAQYDKLCILTESGRLYYADIKKLLSN